MQLRNIEISARGKCSCDIADRVYGAAITLKKSCANYYESMIQNHDKRYKRSPFIFCHEEVYFEIVSLEV